MNWQKIAPILLGIVTAPIADSDMELRDALIAKVSK